MNKLSYYGEMIEREASRPSGLAHLLIQMSVDFAEASNNLLYYEKLQADHFVKEKDFGGEKQKSDATVKALWLRTKEGQEWNATKKYLKALSSLQSNIKASIRHLQEESRNQY